MLEISIVWVKRFIKIDKELTVTINLYITCTIMESVKRESM